MMIRKKMWNREKILPWTSLVVQWLRILLYGFEPWSWKVPYASEQLSPQDAITEAHPEARALQQEMPLQREA